MAQEPLRMSDEYKRRAMASPPSPEVESARRKYIDPKGPEAPEAPAPGGWEPSWLRPALLAGSFAPPLHPALLAVRGVSGGALAGLSALDAVNAASQGNYGEAAIDAVFAALGIRGVKTARLGKAGKPPAGGIPTDLLQKVNERQAQIKAATKGGNPAAVKPPTPPPASATPPRTITMPKKGATMPTPGEVPAPVAAKPGAKKPAAAPQTDATDMTPLLGAYKSSIAKMKADVKAGKVITPEVRKELEASTQFLALIGQRVGGPQGAQIAKVVKNGNDVLGGAKTAVPKATQTVLSEVDKLVKGATVRAEKLRKSTPEVQSTAKTVKGLAAKAKLAPDVLQKVEETLLKVKAKTPKQKKAINDLGFASAKLLAQMGGALAGGVSGAIGGGNLQPDDDPRDPATWKWAGAAGGALLGAMGANLAMTPGKVAKLEKLVDWNRFSLLSSPKAMGTANLGAFSSVIVKAMERVAEGRPDLAAKGLAELASDGAKLTWFRALAQGPLSFLPQPAQAAFAANSRVPVTKKLSLTNWPGRVIAAGDVVSIRALTKMGYSQEQAMAANLSSEPVTQVGKGFMRLFGEPVKSSVLATRGKNAGKMVTKIEEPLYDPKSNPALHLVMRYLQPFARVGVNAVEQGISYSPFGVAPSVRAAHGLTKPEAIRRAVVGTGVSGAGVAQAQLTSPEFDPIFAALGGPASLGVIAGQRFSRAMDSDQPLQSAAQGVLEELPMIGEQFGVQDMPGRLIPGLARDIGQAIDPAFAREKGPAGVIEAMGQQGTTPSPMGGVAATLGAGMLHRLPILREALPERSMPVDVWGKPLYPTNRPAFIPDVTLRGKVSGKPEILFPKVIARPPLVNPPTLPVGDPTAQKLRALGKQVPDMGAPVAPPLMPQFPELEADMRQAGVRPVPMDRDTRLAGLRARGVTNETVVRSVMESPGFSNLPAKVQHRIIREAWLDASKESSSTISPMIEAATVAPQAREQIRESLRAYITAMEGSQ